MFLIVSPSTLTDVVDVPMSTFLTLHSFFLFFPFFFFFSFSFQSLIFVFLSFSFFLSFFLFSFKTFFLSFFLYQGDAPDGVVPRADTVSGLFQAP